MSLPVATIVALVAACSAGLRALAVRLGGGEGLRFFKKCVLGVNLVNFAVLAAAPATAAEVRIARYGTMPDGRAVEQASFTNDRGMVVKVIGYGATVTDILV